MSEVKAGKTEWPLINPKYQADGAKPRPDYVHSGVLVLEAWEVEEPTATVDPNAYVDPMKVQFHVGLPSNPARSACRGPPPRRTVPRSFAQCVQLSFLMHPSWPAPVGPAPAMTCANAVCRACHGRRVDTGRASVRGAQTTTSCLR
jgi:hypothetical protein